MWTFFKSVLVGLAAMFATIVIAIITIGVTLSIKAPHGQSFAWDPISFVHHYSPVPWLVLLVAFALGF